MKHIFLIIIVLLSSTIRVHSQEMTDAESVIKEKIDSYLVELYKGNLDAYTEMFAEEGVYYFEGKPVEGKETISIAFSNLNFPKVKFTHKLNPIRKFDNMYVVTYQVTEEDGFSYENIELWQEQEGAFEIVYARFNELGKQNAGIQPPIFVAGIVLFGLFLFALLIVFRKAKNYKASKK